MEARTAAPWRVEGVRQVAQRVGPPRERELEDAARGGEARRAPSGPERAEAATPVFRDFTYRVDELTGKIVVEVRDGLTGELIRQIPPEELLKVMRSIHEYLGLRVDRRT